jgi:hypothetical protein
LMGRFCRMVADMLYFLFECILEGLNQPKWQM